jgi:hypothetical protein
MWFRRLGEANEEGKMAVAVVMRKVDSLLSFHPFLSSFWTSRLPAQDPALVSPGCSPDFVGAFHIRTSRYAMMCTIAREWLLP